MSATRLFSNVKKGILFFITVSYIFIIEHRKNIDRTKCKQSQFNIVLVPQF